MNNKHKKALEQALQEKVNTLAVADIICLYALELYRIGQQFGMINKAQMAAVGNKIRRSKNLAEAQQKAAEFLQHQMEKLQKREKAGAKPSSWRTTVSSGEDAKPIGDLLVDWINKPRYISAGDATLTLLHNFWSQVEVLYKYHSTTGQEAIINKEIGL